MPHRWGATRPKLNLLERCVELGAITVPPAEACGQQTSAGRDPPSAPLRGGVVAEREAGVTWTSRDACPRQEAQALDQTRGIKARTETLPVIDAAKGIWGAFTRLILRGAPTQGLGDWRQTRRLRTRRAYGPFWRTKTNFARSLDVAEVSLSEAGYLLLSLTDFGRLAADDTSSVLAKIDEIAGTL